jgi:hypothetical protein
MDIWQNAVRELATFDVPGSRAQAMSTLTEHRILSKFIMDYNAKPKYIQRRENNTRNPWIGVKTRHLAICREEISHLQRAWHAAREEAMSALNAAEKRAALASDIRDLQAGNQQLRIDAEEASRSVEPLKLKRDEHTRCFNPTISAQI